LTVEELIGKAGVDRDVLQDAKGPGTIAAGRTDLQIGALAPDRT